MAREFDDDAANYLEASSAVVSGLPVTIAGWAFADLDTGVNSLVTIGNTVTGNGYFWLSTVAAGLSCVYHDGTASATALSTGSFTTGNWFHFAAVFAGVSDRRVFLDGVKDTNTTTLAGTPTLNRTSIGIFRNGAASFPWDGRIAELGIWNVALDDEDIVAQASGATPMMVRPDALVTYVPMFRGSGASDEYDWVGGLTFSEVGVVTIRGHPFQVVYPHEQIYILPPASSLGRIFITH